MILNNNKETYIVINDSDGEDTPQLIDSQLAMARVEIMGLELLERQSCRRRLFSSDGSETSYDTRFDFDDEWLSLRGSDEDYALDRGEQTRGRSSPRRRRLERTHSDGTVDSLVLARTRIDPQRQRHQSRNEFDEDSIVLARRRMSSRSQRNSHHEEQENDELCSVDVDSNPSVDSFSIEEPRTMPLKEEPELETSPRRRRRRMTSHQRRRQAIQNRRRSNRMFRDSKEL